MPCYSPLEAWRSSKQDPETGSRPLVFSVSQGDPELPVTVPCGRCIGCRLEYSRQWAVRIMNEAQLHDENCFVTLTYSEDCLPYPPSLKVREFQLFAKRLRKEIGPFRYFHCGEYGDDNNRPHYYACIFGYSFPDRVLFSRKNGNNLFTSDTLDRCWSRGFASVGDLSFESAAYVARYVTKKVTGDQAAEAYEYVDSETGETFDLKPPYCSMSRRPGIGREWFDLYRSDVYPSDFLVMRGVKQKPPKAYDRFLREEDERASASVKRERIKRGKDHRADQTSSRLKTREKVKMAQIQNLKRSL